MDYLKIATVDEFKDKYHKTVTLLGRPVGIIKRKDGSFFAIEASCKHQGADLLGNYKGGDIAVCPRHKWKYELESGRCISNDSPPLRKYGLKLEENNILITLTPIED